MHGTALGVGPALRKIRTARGLTVDEASRDTRIRREFLEALEAEDFDRLLGDVHVRGCLRTYASYLRLSPDKVVAAYTASQPGAEPVPSLTGVPPAEPVLGARRRRDNHRLVGMIAAVVLVLFAAFGVLSARQPAPPPAELPSEAVPVADVPADRAITVAISARQPVEVTVDADGGGIEHYVLESGEGRSFDATDRITISLSDGDAARVTVNGTDYGYPGAPDRPWTETFDYGSGSDGTGSDDAAGG